MNACKYLPLLLGLSACTTMLPETETPGWPALTVTVHESTKDVHTQCASKLPAWQRVLGLDMVMACANIRFDLNTCDVWVGDPGSYPPSTLAHELEHCRGMDHDGRFAVALARWNDWRANHE